MFLRSDVPPIEGGYGALRPEIANHFLRRGLEQRLSRHRLSALADVAETSRLHGQLRKAARDRFTGITLAKPVQTVA